MCKCLMVFSVVVFGACGMSRSTGPSPADAADAAADIAPDAPADVLPELCLDTTPDLPPPNPCLTLPFEGIVPVDLYGPDTQLHGAAAFDGAGIWIAYNRRDVDGGSGFDVFGTRVGCDGAVLVAPFLVNENVSFNETDPAIAASGDTVMIAWQSDNPDQSPNNLSVWYRSYLVDGTPAMDEERRLDFDPADLAIDPNTWMPALTGTEAGFALAAAHAPEGYGFQICVQRFDPVGAPVDGVVHLLPDLDHYQMWPTIGTDHDGTLLVGWERQHVDLPTVVEYVALAADGAVSGPYHPMGDEPGTAPSLASAATNGFAWLAFGYEVDSEHLIALYNAGFLRAGAETQILDNDGGLDHSPVVATGAGGHALAWYRSLGGVKADLLIRTFTDGGGAPQWGGDPVAVNPVPAASYMPAALVALPGGFFISWSDGDNPDYRLKGRFVRKGD